MLVTAIFAIQFLYCLPFLGNTRVFNPETVGTLISYFIYAGEPFSFPLGEIKSITFPFVDGNVGNVGALPLFAITFKALGKVLSYFQKFDYFIFVEILSSFLTAYFSMKILLMLGVRHVGFRILGALLVGTSLIMLIRSASLQPFCVVQFPLFTIWMYLMLLVLQGKDVFYRKDLLVMFIFPITALIDNYTLVGIILGTSVLVVFEFYESYFGGLASSWSRFNRIFWILIAGICLSILSLYIIGMYPLPSMASFFTSYDVGAGGRYHVADLFSLFIPVGDNYSGLPVSSLLGKFHFLPNTNQLGKGQHEGVAYIGTAIIFIWFFLIINFLYSCKISLLKYRKKKEYQFRLHSSWMKLGIASIVVFLFSFGYELHVLGMPMSNFPLMPAAWLSDRIPALYNIRAPGRLAILLSLFIILEGIRSFHKWYDNYKSELGKQPSTKWFSRSVHLSLVFFAIIHLVEISSLLKPVAVQASHPIGGVYSEEDIKELRRLGDSYDVVLIAPTVKSFDVEWMTEAYALAYYLELPSNLYLIARTIPQHDNKIAKDLFRIENGEWDSLINEYGNILFAMPYYLAEQLRSKMENRFSEVRIGPVSLWTQKKVSIST